MLDALNIDTPYLTVKKEYTLAGTRPGAPVAGALAVLDYLGVGGMKAVVAGCMKNTRRLIAGMETLGIEAAATPDVNVATFVCDKGPGTVEDLVDQKRPPADRLHAARDPQQY